MGQNFTTQTDEILEIWKKHLNEPTGVWHSGVETKKDLYIRKLRDLDKYLQVNYPAKYKEVNTEEFEDLKNTLSNLIEAETYDNQKFRPPNFTLRDLEFKDDLEEPYRKGKNRQPRKFVKKKTTSNSSCIVPKNLACDNSCLEDANRTASKDQDVKVASGTSVKTCQENNVPQQANGAIKKAQNGQIKQLKRRNRKPKQDIAPKNPILDNNYSAAGDLPGDETSKDQYLELLIEDFLKRHDQNVNSRDLNSTTSGKLRSEGLEPSRSPTNSTLSTNTTSSSTSKSYTIDPENPGICLIIDQEEFYPSREHRGMKLLRAPLQDREGTAIDSEKLVETFKRFSFTVILRRNLTDLEMVAAIKDAVMSVKNHSSLIICILSHGLKGLVFGINSLPVFTCDIKKTMCTNNIPNLEGKPKILILQSCQGIDCQEVVIVEPQSPLNVLEEDGLAETRKPTTVDILTFYATVPGFSAIRDIYKGTWFIQALCEVIIENHKEDHFEEICTQVIKGVSELRWGTKAMVPLKETTLTQKFYLPPIDQIEDFDFELL